MKYRAGGYVKMISTCPIFKNLLYRLFEIYVISWKHSVGITFTPLTET